jgi:endonuclease YncB( thermonuclease family)
MFRMNKICQKCQKVNNYEIRVCSCGYEFFQSASIEENFQPYRRNQKTFQKVLGIGILVVFGLLLTAGLLEPEYFFDKLGIGKYLQDDHTASLNNSAKTIYSSETNSSSPPLLTTRVIQADVLSVDSGDLITVRDKIEGTTYQIKLAGIMAPAVSDEFGVEAQKNLSDLVLHKPVSIIVGSGSQNDPALGKVIYQNIDINLEQLKSGLVTRSVGSELLLTDVDRKLYQDAAYQATTNKIGIWSDAPAESVPPTVPVDAKAETLTTSPPIIQSKLKPPKDPQPPREKALQPQQSSVPTSESPKIQLSAKSTPVPTARCQDGTVSYSPSRSGACSSHGGVVDWQDDSKKSSAAKVKPLEKKYLLGSRGGCYFVNSNGTKIYVDRKMCE